MEEDMDSGKVTDDDDYGGLINESSSARILRSYDHREASSSEDESDIQERRNEFSSNENDTSSYDNGDGDGYMPLTEEFGEFTGADTDAIILEGIESLSTDGFSETKQSDEEDGVMEVENPPSIPERRVSIEPLSKEKISRIREIMSKIQIKPRTNLDMLASKLENSKIRVGDEI